MGQKASVCESIEPPGTHTTTISLHQQTLTDTVQEFLPLFDDDPCFSNSIGFSARKIQRSSAPAGKSETAEVIRFRTRFFPEVSDAEWNDWHWQMRNRIRSFDQLAKIIPLSPEERAARQNTDIHFPLSITPYYLSLFFDKDFCHPLRKSMVPQVFETLTSPAEAKDPLGEESQSPVPGLVHRYPDRALFLVTTTCSCYCRYCTRCRVVGNHEHRDMPLVDQWNAGIAYIRAHHEIRDVLISGGDPFMLSDDQLQWIISSLRKIPHVEIIRIGTKTPMVLPQRITPQLVRMLKRYHPLFVSIHATHPDEVTDESTEACGRLADAGIPLGSQTVLLAGVNDSVDTMRRLMHGLLRMRVRPYYLYQCDPILGSGHFRTPVQKGIDIIRGLRGHTTGYALPTFVIDAPGGGGKIPIAPDYVARRDGGNVILTNYNNETFIYPDEKAVTAVEPALPVEESSGGVRAEKRICAARSADRQLLRIGLTYDLRSEYLTMGYSEEATAEFDRDDTIESIEAALAACGYETERIGHLRTLTAKLAAGERWGLVFNVAEGMSGYSREAQVPALLEGYGIPFTGSDALTLALTHHKGYTKKIVEQAGVPTPAFAVVACESDIDSVHLPFPLFVKPVAEGTGKGVTGKSRVTNTAELREQCRYVLETFHQPALVETYLPGREITMGVLGTGSAARAIGALEIEALQGAEANAYSYYNKENCEEVIRYSLVTDTAMLASAEKICLAAWRALGGRDACRMDLRADGNGDLSFIEVNALPGLHPQHSDLPMICDRIGMPFRDLIGNIVTSARERYGI